MAQPRIGNAPVSWGVYEAHLPNPPFAGVLDAIKAAGYEGTELGPYGYLPRTREALASELDARGLALGSSFVPAALEDASSRDAAVAHALKVARLLTSFGVTELIIADDEDPQRASHAGRVPGDGSGGWSGPQWTAAIETLDTIAERVMDECGMSLVVHHHAGTFIETPREIDRLLESTRPERVNLLLDTGHAAYGGGDPVEMATRHGARIRYVHLKDVDAAELERVRTTPIPMGEAWKRGVFCPLGEGVVDFKGVVSALATRGYEGWMIVEQDVVPDESGRLQPDPSESAKKSRTYLREVLGL